MEIDVWESGRRLRLWCGSQGGSPTKEGLLQRQFDASLALSHWFLGTNEFGILN